MLRERLEQEGVDLTRRSFILGGTAAGIGLVLARLKLGGLRVTEAATLLDELPPHITYFPRSEQKYLEGASRIVKPLLPGDIWLAQAQKLRVMGVDFNINPEADPGRAYVFAIGAVNHLDLDFSTIEGVYAWTGLESSPRTGGSFLRDIETAGRVQVSRAQIPGNCVPSGCSDVRLIMALGHRDLDGVVRYDPFPEERYIK